MVLTEKGIVRQFSLVVYNQDFVAVIGDMEDSVNRIYKPRDSKYNWLGAPDPEHPMGTYEVIERKTGAVCYMIWCLNPEDFKGSYVCHETGHVVLTLFKYIGATPNVDDQEPFCYLLGTIFRLMNGAFYEYQGYLDKKKKSKNKKK